MSSTILVNVGRSVKSMDSFDYVPEVRNDSLKKTDEILRNVTNESNKDGYENVDLSTPMHSLAEFNRMSKHV